MGRGLVLGVGINDLPRYHNCPFYSRWKGILRRCFGERDDRHYEGCQVAEQWLRFSAFKAWMESQPWIGNHLDKDILSPGERIYRPETSVFVPSILNNLAIERPSQSGDLPVGVSRTRRGKPFMARVHWLDGSRTSVGSFDCPHEAHRAWATAKAGVIRQAVDQYRTTDRFDERVCAALLDRADQLAAT